MEKNNNTSQPLSENQSLQVIREMIAGSSKNLKNDGLLLLAWGWVGVAITVMHFVPNLFLISKRLIIAFKILTPVLMVAVILFTAAYMYQKRMRVKTYVAIAARYTWFSVVIVYNLVVMVLKVKTGTVDFSLLHPLQMLLIGMALFITGGLYRYWLLSVGGVVYWLAALISAQQNLNYQLVIETIPILIGFVIPGHILYSQYHQNHV